MADSARHVRALAGADQRASFRAFMRERAGSAGCGGLASERVRSEPGALWRHGLEGGIFLACGRTAELHQHLILRMSHLKDSTTLERDSNLWVN